MNTLNPQSLKRLLLAFGLSISIIIVFLILRLYLSEEKEITHKSFTKPASEQVIQEEDIKEEERKFRLLPSKD